MQADGTAERFFSNVFAAAPLMVILRGFTPETTVELCARAVDLGVRTIEVPAQGETGLRALSAAIDWGADKPLVAVGAGTVTDCRLLERVASAGAQFIVAPGIEADVARRCAMLDLPYLPGVATATEVGRAAALGLSWQKAFPASILTPGWVAAMHGPFPDVNFVATGGVNTSNATEFLSAGAAAASLGSSFADADQAAVQRIVAK